MQAASQQSWVCLSQLVCPHKQAEGHIDLELGEKCGCEHWNSKGLSTMQAKLCNSTNCMLAGHSTFLPWVVQAAITFE